MIILLCQAKAMNISFVTFDEFVTRMENFIEVLEKYSTKHG